MLEPSLVNGFLSVLVAEARKILAKNKRTSRHFSTEAVSNAGRITAAKNFFFFFKKGFTVVTLFGPFLPLRANPLILCCHSKVCSACCKCRCDREREESDSY